MSRGTYSPRPRDDGRGFYATRDPLFVDWTLGRYARRQFHERVDPVTAQAAFVAVSALKAGRGAADVYAGSRAFSDRGQTPVTQVGGAWWHGTADRERALVQLSIDFVAFAGDLAAWQEAHENPATAQWIATAVTPTLEEWQRFVTRERSSWWTKAATSWDTFESWLDRLKRLRELALAHGIVLHSTNPVALPKTIWQKSENGNGGEAAAWLGVLKLVVLGAIGITGAIALYSGLRDLRGKGRDLPVKCAQVSCYGRRNEARKSVEP